MSLSASQIRALRAEAHRLNLKPVVMIGQNGLTENVDQEIDQALQHHEMIKLRLPALEKEGKKALIEQICAEHQATLVQSIGHVIILFRQNPKRNRFKAQLKA